MYHGCSEYGKKDAKKGHAGCPGRGAWPAAGLLRPIVEWSITEFEKQTCLCFVEVDPAETDPESPKYLGADHQSIAIMARNPVDGWRKGRCAGVEDAPGL